MPHVGEQLAPPAVSVQFTALLFPVSFPILAFSVIVAPPGTAELILLPGGILRPVFMGAVLLSKNGVIANCVLSATEIAPIRGRSYGADGRDAGGVYVIVVVVVFPDATGALGVPSVPHEFVPIFEQA